MCSLVRGGGVTSPLSSKFFSDLIHDRGKNLSDCVFTRAGFNQGPIEVIRGSDRKRDAALYPADP